MFLKARERFWCILESENYWCRVLEDSPIAHLFRMATDWHLCQRMVSSPEILWTPLLTFKFTKKWASEKSTDINPSTYVIVVVSHWALTQRLYGELWCNKPWGYRVPLKSTTGIYIGDRHRIVACSYGLHFGFISSIFLLVVPWKNASQIVIGSLSSTQTETWWFQISMKNSIENFKI